MDRRAGGARSALGRERPLRRCHVLVHLGNQGIDRVELALVSEAADERHRTELPVEVPVELKKIRLDQD